MANQEHCAKLQQGSDAWNAWRKEHPDAVPDLSWAELQELDLSKTNLARAYLRGAQLDRTILRGAILWKADLAQAHLNAADLREANLRKANLFEAELSGAQLQGANLTGTLLVDTKLQQADLTGCFVYGCSVWNVDLEGAIQSDLVLLDAHSSYREWNPALVNQSALKVDDLEVAQFIYLLRANRKMRDVIDTITSKAVLILGRFTPERKAVLDALRTELRDRYNRLPIIFDFERPADRDVTETVIILAGLARFVIADLTDASSVQQELTVIKRTYDSVPIQPVVHEGSYEWAMFPDLQRGGRVLDPYVYQTQEQLVTNLPERVIEPAEQRARELKAEMDAILARAAARRAPPS
jgi:Pentapeptide repeats (8 copies)